MKAIHGAKAKNDRIDSLKIASLLRGGNFPVAYVYPRLMRAFSEAAVLLYSKSAEAKVLVDRIAKKHGKSKALSIFAHKIGRTVYYMLKNRQAFHLPTFLST